MDPWRARVEEDRLNPVPPPDADEATLGGYRAIHGRPPAFAGPGGCPYTVDTVVEREAGAWVGYLVFLRWSPDGRRVVAHRDSPVLVRASSAAAAAGALHALGLAEVRRWLDRVWNDTSSLHASPDLVDSEP